MRKLLRNVSLFLFVLPLTLFLDFILFNLARSCPSCGSFSQWIWSEGALSFPLVVSFSEWFEGALIRIKEGAR